MVSSQRPLILIVDKDNLFGSLLAHVLTGGAIALVTKEHVVAGESVVVVPYIAPLPQIPDGIYTHIVLVYSEKEQHLVGPLSQKAAAQGIDLVIILRNEDREKEARVSSFGLVFVLGDLFDISGQFELTEFLRNTKQTKKITLSNMGLHVWHPVFLQDAARKIAELLVSEKQTRKVFIGPSHGYTALSLAHGLQKIDPDLKIDFSDTQGKQVGEKIVSHSAFEQYDALSALQGIYKRISVEKKPHVLVPEQATVVRKKKKSKARWVMYAVYVVFTAILTPVVFAIACASLGVFLLAGGVVDAQNGNTASSLQKVRAAQVNFSVSRLSLDVLEKEANAVGQGSAIGMLQQKVTEGEVISHIAESAIVVFDSGKKVITGKTINPEADAEKAVSAFKQASLALQDVSLSDFPQYKDAIRSLQSVSSQLGGVIDLLPDVLGVNTDKTYLILFQNNMELRPGGGFIGSYGLLQLHHGSVQSFTIHDVYDADGQLKGHVEPPFAIRRYIPIVHLYLRDSNFDPNFAKDAETVAQLFAQETGSKVDGVIGVDLNALRAVLSATGGVYVPSYNETVTEKNFFVLLEQHAEKNFFPGSTQKKDFLRAFAEALLSRMQKGQNLHIVSLLADFGSLISGKDIVAAFSDPTIQVPFALAGFSGTVPDVHVSDQNSLHDFAGVVEANLGVNKVNAFIERGLVQQVTIDAKGNAVERLTLTLKNTSDGSWPGGEYKNYLRFMVPQNAVVKSILIDNVEQQMVSAVTNSQIYETKSFVAPRGLEVAKEFASGLTYYGFLVTVPEMATKTITISYEIPRALSLSSQKQTYSLHVWKQIGVDAFPYTMSLTIPQSMQFLSSGGEQDGQTVTFTTTVNADKDMNASFAAQ